MAIYYVNFGVNFFFEKFCPCKKNDKYEVCLKWLIFSRKSQGMTFASHPIHSLIDCPARKYLSYKRHNIRIYSHKYLFKDHNVTIYSYKSLPNYHIVKIFCIKITTSWYTGCWETQYPYQLILEYQTNMRRFFGQSGEILVQYFPEWTKFAL